MELCCVYDIIVEYTVVATNDYNILNDEQCILKCIILKSMWLNYTQQEKPLCCWLGHGAMFGFRKCTSAMFPLIEKREVNSDQVRF